MKITSPEFVDNSHIPAQYTCDGEDISPPLQITGVPAEAETLALVVDDPDAPGGVFDHWIVWNIPSTLEKIPQGIPQKEIPEQLEGATQGRNDFKQIGYRGPCPPSGEHRYRFKLYALDRSLDLSAGSSKEDLEGELREGLLEQSELVGLYQS